MQIAASVRVRTDADRGKRAHKHKDGVHSGPEVQPDPYHHSA